MRIKKLEIFGFKSFADRVVINFDAGVTGIVGPNGCGKSNVVDALRWVMGEQNAKHLRGDQMQDIIFNGAQNRGSMGMAEVTLTLENDGQLVPQEYAHFDEIEVTRRLYRNGNSEYEINRRECRLRDITEFFLGTGVGTKAYSIIEQGRISSIVQAKPEERRQIIEEAAGITKYKMRKQAAERKMESTQQNLLRIQDITKEVENRLASLEKQAQKAERFQNLNTQVRDLELHDACLKFFEFTNQLSYLSNAQNQQESILNQHSEAILEHESRFSLEREALTDHDQALSLTVGMIHALENTMALAKQDIQFTQNTLSSKQKQAVHIQTENKRLQDRMAELHTEQASLLDLKSLIESETQRLRLELSKASQQIQEVTKTRADKHRSQQDIQSKIMQTSREATQAQADMNSLIQQREQAKARDKTLESELDLLKNQLEAQATQKQSLQTEITDLGTQKANSQTQIQDLQSQITTLTQELGQKAGTKQQYSQKIASKQGRLSALLDSLKDSKKPEHLKFKHLADQVDIPEQFESLVEDACSQRLEAYLVSSLSEGFELAKQGRIRFFEQSTKPFKFEVVADTTEALKKWPAAISSQTILITEAGELFDIDHSCVAGTRTKSAGLLAKKREIQTLQAELLDLETEDQKNSAEITNLNTQKDDLSKNLETQRSALQALSLTLVRLEEALRNKESNDKNLSARIQTLENEKQKLLAGSPLSEQNLKLLQDKWALALDVHQKLESDFRTIQTDLTEFEADFSTQSESFTKLRIEAASAEERQNNFMRSQQQTLSATHLY
ncbi:MAG: AAA family ATPase, partial [Myxococcaceae bacterium]